MGVKVKQRPGDPDHWWVFINHDRKRIAKSFATKKAADNFATEVQEAQAKTDWKLPTAPVEPAEPPLTFRVFTARFLDANEPRDGRASAFKYSTWRDYQSVMKAHLYDLIGDRPIAEITKRDVKDLEAQLRTSKRPSVADKCLRILSSIMSEAVEDEIIATNPALQLRKRRRKKLSRGNDHTKKRIEPFTTNELRHIMAVARDHEIERGDKKVKPFAHSLPFITVMAHTGLRLGEAIALKFGDVDLRGGFIEVRRSCTQGRIGTTKSDKVRRVDLTTTAAKMIAELHARRLGAVVDLDPERQAEREAEAANALLDAWVFTDGEGGRIEESNFRRRIWKPLLVTAKVRKRRIHDLRHSYASLLIDAGESVHYVQQQLGHHSPAFTLAVYGHLIPRDRRGVEQLADIMPGAVNSVAPGLRRNVQNGPIESAPVVEKVENTRAA